MVTIGNCEQDFVMFVVDENLQSYRIQEKYFLIKFFLVYVDLREKKLTPPSKVSFTVSILMHVDVVGKLRPVTIGKNSFRAFLLRFGMSSPKSPKLYFQLPILQCG